MPRFTHPIASLYAKLKQRLPVFDSDSDSVQILPYIGYGTSSKVYLRGRVVEKHRVVSGRDDDSRWRNVRNSYHRFNSHALSGVEIVARINGQIARERTDKAGFYAFEVSLETPLSVNAVWHTFELELPDYAGQRGASAESIVLIPAADTQFAVISDLDDTVLRSQVINKLKLARNTFFYNAHTRLPFAGVAEFYQALQAGTYDQFNPIFYVSNSPWNLYDMIVDFFNVRGIPLGPISLIHLGLSPTHLSRPDPIKNKLQMIEQLVTTYPELPFILIGDSGEHDTEIYLQVIKDFPGRIQAVYIRDVTNAERSAKIRATLEQADTLNVPVLLVDDTVAAAEHAVVHGFIEPQALSLIRQERHVDAQAVGDDALLDS